MPRVRFKGKLIITAEDVVHVPEDELEDFLSSWRGHENEWLEMECLEGEYEMVGCDDCSMEVIGKDE